MKHISGHLKGKSFRIVDYKKDYGIKKKTHSELEFNISKINLQGFNLYVHLADE